MRYPLQYPFFLQMGWGGTEACMIINEKCEMIKSYQNQYFSMNYNQRVLLNNSTSNTTYNENRLLHPHLDFLFIIFKLIKSIQYQSLYTNQPQMIQTSQNHTKHKQKNSSKVSNTIKYQIKDQPFIIPIKFKKQVPLNKNFFELKQAQPKNYQQNEENVQMTEMTMLDPMRMSIATLKFLLLQKIITYTSLFSIGLSIFEVHFIEQPQIQQSLMYFHTAITILLLICTVFSAVFHAENNKSRRMEYKYLVFQTIAKSIIILLSPNPWWWGREFFISHLTLLGRLFFPITLYIRLTLYYSPRAARIINLYGIKPEMTFEFAWKVIFNDMQIIEVLFMYICVVLLYSHCLFLAATDTPFIDCFEIVIVTLPTVGYGEYRVVNNIPRAIIIVILLTGVALNAFVTLTMLKNFQMTTNQSNSYILMEKLNMIEQIEELSSQFIIRKIQQKCSKSDSLQREKDQNFKESYKQCKEKYRKLNKQDSGYQFNIFKGSLVNLKIKIHQVNNMVNVLLARLMNSRREQKAYFKNIKKPN